MRTLRCRAHSWGAAAEKKRLHRSSLRGGFGCRLPPRTQACPGLGTRAAATQTPSNNTAASVVHTEPCPATQRKVQARAPQ
jgi:hypothetical protein